MKDVVEKFRNILSSLMFNHVFYGLLLKRLRVVYINDENMPPCGVNKREIILSPKFFRYNNCVQQYILAHEAMHVALSHPERMRRFAERFKILNINVLFNVVADGKINDVLDEEFECAPDGRITISRVAMLLDIDVETLRKLSVEEILLRAIKKGSKMAVKIDEIVSEPTNDISPETGKGQCEKSGKKVVVLNEGDREIEKAKDDKELEKIKKKILAEVLVSSKSIGRAPLGVERIVSGMLKPKVDWRRIIKSAMEKALGNDVRKTWSRSSRKNPDYPAKYTIGVNKVIILADTSGSISQKQLRQYIGEIFSISKIARKIIVVPWDVEAYKEIVVRSRADIRKVRVGLRGGGGTLIHDALKKALDIMSNGDIVVILSDYYIGDLYGGGV
ncbi:hypothetical protein DRJ17_07535, partial [Candidatus Woesearchaeota archaeon]